MSVSDQEDNSYQNIQDKQGTTVISVIPKQNPNYASSPHKKSKRRGSKKDRLPKIMNNYYQPQAAQSHSKDKQGQHNSETKIRGVDEQTAGDLQENGIPVPYEFLTQRNPSVFRIFFPRFALKSITFFLTLIYIIMFLVLIGYNYSKEQTDITWNCSLYRLQNKYFPRLNIKHEIWRVFISAFFHSNIAHFCLNLFALQIYGYFIEWYYEKKIYVLTLLCAMVYSHFFSSVIQNTTVSTTSSALTMSIIGLKIFFLWEYRSYKKLIDRRAFLYILLTLIIAINLIPVFVTNNVDYSCIIGGLLVGLMIGFFVYKNKIEQQTSCDKLLKWTSMFMLLISFILVVTLTFILKNQDFQYLSQNIETMCINNHT